MSSTRTACLVLAALLLGPSSADAEIITNNVEIDLSQARIFDDGSGGQLLIGYDTTLKPVTPFTPQVGDTLVTTVTFAHGDRLKISDGPNIIDSVGPNHFESLVFYFFGDGYHSTNTTDVSFADLNGHLSDSTPGGSSTGVLGQALYPNFTDGYVSFSGLTLTTTILALPNPGAQSYDQFGIYSGLAGGFEIEVAAVPEPSSMCLAALACAGYGALRRRQKATSLAVDGTVQCAARRGEDPIVPTPAS